MNFNEYQETIRQFRKPSANFEYAVVGLGAEVGEVQDKVAKAIRDNGSVINDEIREGILKELGDVLWFVSAIADDLNADLDYVAQTNVDKLASRKARDVISGSGDDR